ncbi:MAG: 30S ribosome-binding factor RbfA [Candidatus Pacebacteria bacterium]|nr:30S ribosome-binding factor RbfA [Candidatus Paceibacterota bacterium]
MEGRRLEKFNEVLKEELAMLVCKEIDLPKGVLATIIGVKIDERLIRAEVFVSVIPAKETEFVMNVFNAKANFLHQLLNDKIRVRRIPRLKFMPESNLPESQKVSNILDEISNVDNN